MLFFNIILSLFLFSSYQDSKPEPAVGKVIYSFSHMLDTNNASRFYKEEMMLLFGNKSSLYTSYTRMVQDSIKDAKIKEAGASDSNAIKINMGVIRISSPEQIFTYKEPEALYINMQFNDNNYLITEPLAQIKWQIAKDTRKIAGYICQKATCIFRGRNYIAWFTLAIPAGFGPWKLQGLPGLILEAYDEKKQVNFICENVMLNKNIAIINFPANAIKTTMAEYNRMVNAFRENPGAAFNDKGITISVDPSSTVSPRKQGRINNPIELTNN
ncbi:GLPGLI family protein [Parafilimonas sp.]|uniref:GLPGLI family protein n=1 Tax=Parafilimonas sp. TaxID=1969739 RepID=UPI0039E2EEE1